jgi:two-component system sensor histidine kinase CiaH
VVTMFKTVIFKLTAIYVLLAMALSLTFSVVSYRIANHELEEGLNRQYHQIVDDDHDGDNKHDYDDVTASVLQTRMIQIRNDLALVNIAVFTGSLAAGYLLARRTLRPIEAAHREQVRFTAEVSHELKTPLTAMKADTESLLMQPSANKTELRATLSQNLEDIERLERLTKHLLDMGRYRSDMKFISQDVDLEGLIENVTRQLQVKYSHKHIIDKHDISVSHVFGDSTTLEQLLIILMDNSYKYSNNKASVHVDVHSEQHNVVLTISDSGVGIGDIDLPHIFEHFYRSSSSKAAKTSSGYGLGLPLAKDIVERYRGTISVDSKLGKGTVIHIRLPLKVGPKKG